ncbi:MAG: FmdB family zinc ribbon protein [Acidobacteriota bacterium]
MPIYEYRCKDCNEKFEFMQKVGDQPIEQCPKCRGRLFRIISPPAIQFKGSGWYITDYARKDPRDGKGKGDKKDETTKQGKSDENKDSYKN